MRFLADAGVSPDTVAFLTRLGHDAIPVRAIGMHRAQDRELVDHARSEGRVIVTFDLDFGDILALGVLDRPSVILLRLSDERPAEVNGRLGCRRCRAGGSARIGCSHPRGGRPLSRP